MPCFFSVSGTLRGRSPSYHLAMDPLMTANVQAYVSSMKRSTSVPAGTTMGGTMRPDTLAATRRGYEHASFERKQLVEARRKRGSMMFLDRMEVDVSGKQASQAVAAMRKDPHRRDALDRVVVSMRPEPPLAGPKVVSHSNKTMWQGHDRKMNWAPLEYY